MVRRTGTPAVGGTVQLGERSDTDRLAEVDVARDGGSPHVKPVRVIRSEFLLGTGLDGVDPGGDLELTRPLEVGRVRGDEALSAVWP